LIGSSQAPNALRVRPAQTFPSSPHRRNSRREQRKRPWLRYWSDRRRQHGWRDRRRNRRTRRAAGARSTPTTEWRKEYRRRIRGRVCVYVASRRPRNLGRKHLVRRGYYVSGRGNEFRSDRWRIGKKRRQVFRRQHPREGRIGCRNQRSFAGKLKCGGPFRLRRRLQGVHLALGGDERMAVLSEIGFTPLLPGLECRFAVFVRRDSTLLR